MFLKAAHVASSPSGNINVHSRDVRSPEAVKWLTVMRLKDFGKQKVALKIQPNPPWPTARLPSIIAFAHERIRGGSQISETIIVRHIFERL
jgi:hypothetical protein